MRCAIWVTTRYGGGWCAESLVCRHGAHIFGGRTYTREDEPFSYWLLMLSLALCGCVFVSIGAFGFITTLELLR
jgi:hypothetical protein